ncbi:MAG TPA: hypothetical protein VFD50_03465 [Thermoleophilia bacterium]|nr:hypothetical protein [Thermoleophilia bacterium]
MIIIAAAFLIMFVVWLVRRVVRRVRRAAAMCAQARAQARGAVSAAPDGAPPAEPRAPESRLTPAPADDAADEPQAPRMWGDAPGDERRFAGGRGRP